MTTDITGRSNHAATLRGILLQHPSSPEEALALIAVATDGIKNLARYLSTHAHSQAEVVDGPPYSFIRMPNGRWAVRFDGEYGIARDAVGIRFFAGLLGHPNETIQASHLEEGYREGKHPTWLGMSRYSKRDIDHLDFDEIQDHDIDIEGFSLEGATKGSRRQEIAVLHRTLEQGEDYMRELEEAEDRDLFHAKDAMWQPKKRQLLERLRDLEGKSERPSAVMRNGKNLRTACKILCDAGMPKLVAHLRVTVSGFETPKLSYEPLRDSERAISEWVIRWNP